MMQLAASETVALATVPGRSLAPAAAAAWDTGVRSLGWTPTIVAGGAYRSLASQIDTLKRYYTTTPTTAEQAGATTSNGRLRLWDGRTWYRRTGYPTAATPGTSNHGAGHAVDAGYAGMSFQHWDDPHRLQLLAALAPHGWRDTEGRAVGEPWHITYYPEHDTHPGEGDDMFSDEDRTLLQRTKTDHDKIKTAIDELKTQGVRDREDRDKIKAALERIEKALR